MTMSDSTATELRAIAVYLRDAASLYRKTGEITIDGAVRIFEMAAINVDALLAKQDASS